MVEKYHKKFAHGCGHQANQSVSYYLVVEGLSDAEPNVTSDVYGHLLGEVR